MSDLNGVEPEVRDFKAVRDRALALYERHEKERQWDAFLQALKAEATVTVHMGEDAGEGAIN